MNESIQIVAGTALETLQQARPLTPFSEQALSFLHDLSESLLNRPDCRLQPNLVALGFWLRPASLQKLANDFSQAPAGYQYYPAGLVFHLAPANVDNLFVYSWAISLLCGNSNIIRLSSRESEERQLLLIEVKQLLSEPRHRDILERTAIVSYGHDDATTTALSALASRRVLWGGNETIAHLRALPVPPLCQDIVFPDRRSLALLSTAAVAQAETLDTLLDAFYRDSYGFNQMACSSPRLVLWLNDGNLTLARDRFWSSLTEMVRAKNPPLSSAELMDKQVTMQSMAMTSEVKIRALPDARLQVIKLDAANAQLEAEHAGGGLFLEGVIDKLGAIDAWLRQEHQTLTYWGVDTTELTRLISHGTVPLADRIVPTGHALTFSPVWDGMNLFERLSRLIQLS